MPALLLGSLMGLCACALVLAIGGGWLGGLIAHASCGTVATFAFALYARRRAVPPQVPENPATDIS